MCVILEVIQYYRFICAYVFQAVSFLKVFRKVLHIFLSNEYYIPNQFCLHFIILIISANVYKLRSFFVRSSFEPHYFLL
jgi:hypothetical protein